jgi:large subunit ribosomal protein L25
MQVRELSGDLRDGLGKKGSKAVRVEGKVPCVIYGGEAPVHFSLKELDVEKSLNTPSVYIYKLDLGGKTYEAVLREVQFHPVSDKPLHIDFLAVDQNKPVKIGVPIKLTGVSEGVLAGGKLQIKMRKMNVMALPKDLPDHVEVDITNVNLGQSVKIDSLSYNNIEILDSKNAIVCSVKLTRTAMRDKAIADKDVKKK